METMNPKEIKTHPTFESLFPIKPELLANVEDDMRNQGFDYSQPVIVATWNAQSEPVCVDGHTRIRAAINAGIDNIPIWLREDFESEEEVLEYAIRLQQNRRNMTDAEILACVAALDSRLPRGGDRRSEQAKSKPQGCGIENPTTTSAQRTAEIVGISPRKVEQIRTVLDHADPETLQAVNQSGMSINKAYNETQKKRREAKSEATEPAKEEVKNSDEPPTPATAEHAVEESTGYVTIRIPESQYRALRELGEPIECHLELAIELYLKMAADEMEEASNDFQIAQAV